MLKRAIEDILADIERAINDKMKEFNDSLFTEARKAPHNNDKYDGHCHVKVDIYFVGAGIINIPTEQELLKLMDEIRNSRPNEQSA